MASKTYYVYILGNDRPTLYVGITNDLIRRVWEHKTETIQGLTSRYGVKKLLYFESCPDALEAIKREKCLKHWRRRWKLELIQKTNPELRDLYEELT